MPALVTGRQDLADARESLAYWEDRGRALPRHAVLRRREARVLARRWRSRVADAERARYGSGLLGMLLVLALERRLPEPTRQAGLRLARWTARTFVVMSVALVALALAATVAAIELLAVLLRALSS
jgi:hypothetical protein